MNFWGGKGIGVYKNDEPLPRPANKSLSEGLLGVNSYLFGHNKYGIREIAESSMGTRMYGCAGLELVAILKGNHIAYISNLSPGIMQRKCLIGRVWYGNKRSFGTPLTFEKGNTI